MQGDGTAVCLQDMPGAFTFSMHGATNFPVRKQQSDLDVPLPDGMEDAEYLRYPIFAHPARLAYGLTAAMPLLSSCACHLSK